MYNIYIYIYIYTFMLALLSIIALSFVAINTV